VVNAAVNCHKKKLHEVGDSLMKMLRLEDVGLQIVCGNRRIPQCKCQCYKDLANRHVLVQTLKHVLRDFTDRLRSRWSADRS
jgi:hypothetical protein